MSVYPWGGSLLWARGGFLLEKPPALPIELPLPLALQRAREARHWEKMDLTIDKGRPLTGCRASGAREEWSCVSGRLPVSRLLGPAHAASIAGGFDRRLEAAGSAEKQHIRLGVKQSGKPAIHKPAAGTHKARLSESPGRLEGNPPNRAFPLPASLESSPALSLSGGGPRKLRSPAP